MAVMWTSEAQARKTQSQMRRLQHRDALEFHTGYRLWRAMVGGNSSVIYPLTVQIALYHIGLLQWLSLLPSRLVCYDHRRDLLFQGFVGTPRRRECISMVVAI